MTMTIKRLGRRGLKISRLHSSEARANGELYDSNGAYRALNQRYTIRVVTRGPEIGRRAGPKGSGSLRTAESVKEPKDSSESCPWRLWSPVNLPTSAARRLLLRPGHQRYFDLDTGVLEFWDRSRVRSATSRARNRPSTRHLR